MLIDLMKEAVCSFTTYDDDYINLFRPAYDAPSLEEAQVLDITRIAVFLDDVMYFLDKLVKHRSAFIDDLYDDVIHAWNSAKQRFTTAKDAIVSFLNNGSDQFVSQLQEFGLLDSELKLKLRNIEYQFGDLISMNATDLLKKLFDSINNLLDNVLGILGVHNALKEIKDALR